MMREDEAGFGQPPFRQVESKTVPLTPELAAWMAAMTPSPTERALKPSRVTYLRERLLAGLFHSPHWVIARVGKEGVEMRANGQHSSGMLVSCNGEFPKGLTAHIDVYECPTLDELALLFRQFDDRRSARQPEDVSGAYQGLQKDLLDVPRHIGKLGVEALIWFRKNVRAEAHVPKGDDRYTVFNDTEAHPFLIWLAGILSVKTPEMSRLPVIAAAYATFNSDEDDASSFWHEVARGGRDYEDTHPTTVLDDWLKRVFQGEFEVKPPQLYQGSVYAWNAFREGKALHDIRSDIRKTLAKVR